MRKTEKQGEEGHKEENYEDDEEIVFKIPWLKNPWNDRHFDLKEPEKLVGKTLAWLSSELPQSAATKNVEFLGWMLLGERGNAKNCAMEVENELLDDTVVLYRKVKLDSYGESEKEGKSDDESAQVESNMPQDLVEIVGDELDKLKQGKLSDILLDEFKKRQRDLEAKEISELAEKLQKWNEYRNNLIVTQVEKFLKEERLKEINAEEQEILGRKELLYFFENREEWEKKLPFLEEAKEESKKEAAKQISDEEYVKKIFEESTKKAVTTKVKHEFLRETPQ